MSLERTIGALLLPGFEGHDVPRWVHERIAGGLGGVTLYGRNVADAAQLSALTSRLHAEGDGFVVSLDEEGGDVTRTEVATGSSYPGNGALGAADDPALTAAVAAAMGASLAAAGVDLDLAPVVDVNIDPLNPVIGIRSFGADPLAVSRHTAAFVEGLQSAGVAACLKHFPGHGNTHVDSHRGLPVVDDDLETLERTALPPFRAGIAAGARAVMTAHLVVPAYDTVPATISRRVLTGVLREELGFTGVIVSDGLDMAGLSDTVGFLEGAVLSLVAGADLLCTGGSPTDDGTVDALITSIVAAVREGRLSEDELEASAYRVRDLGHWSAKRRAEVSFDAPASLALGRAAAERALQVHGDVTVGPGAVVVRLGSRPNEAVGVVPWGVGAPMAVLDPSVKELAVESPDVAAASLIASAVGRPLVVVVRDLHRIDWHVSVLAALATARPDLVVVEMGVPMQRPYGVRGYLATYGAARVNGEAAAQVLLPRRS
ncbi:MAG: beta-N-acetylhexosaminidase [Frankiales bacterium]|jgi:beta-N-acetylhexosaminidase|nr:beta-N-acetylhexosaminidase [Frankiales bacterium]